MARLGGTFHVYRKRKEWGPMGHTQLVQPSMEYREQYLAFYRDWVDSGEDIIPWVVERDPSDFEAYVEFLYSEDSDEKVSNENWVPHSTYWLIDGDENIVGAVNIRHRLNQKKVA